MQFLGCVSAAQSQWQKHQRRHGGHWSFIVQPMGLKDFSVLFFLRLCLGSFSTFHFLCSSMSKNKRNHCTAYTKIYFYSSNVHEAADCKYLPTSQIQGSALKIFTIRLQSSLFTTFNC
jgi:hypothetical protein